MVAEISDNLGKHPEQLYLFGVRDYLNALVNSRRFEQGMFDVKILQQGKIPPNDSDEYYFGVPFTDDEHKEFIGILHNLKEVLDFYLNVYNSQADITDSLNCYDREATIKKIKQLLGRDNLLMIGNLKIWTHGIIPRLKSAIEKSDLLQELLDEYGKMKKQKGEAKRTKNNRQKLSQATGREHKKKRSKNGKKVKKQVVYQKLGGGKKVHNIVRANVQQLFVEYGDDRRFIKNNVVNDDYIRSFVAEMPGAETLSPKEKGMAQGLVRWHFAENLK